MVSEADQHPTGEGFDVQVIVVSDSLTMGFHGQSALETKLSADLGEVSLTHAENQEDSPLKHIACRSNKATSYRSGRSRSLLPN